MNLAPTAETPVSQSASWFASEIQPHEPALRAYLRARFPHLTDTEDLLQDTYIRIMRAREAGEIRSTKALLLVTARNLALDFFRRRQIIAIDDIANMDELSVLEEEAGAAETLNRHQELALLEEAIQALPRDSDAQENSWHVIRGNQPPTRNFAQYHQRATHDWRASLP